MGIKSGSLITGVACLLTAAIGAGLLIRSSITPESHATVRHAGLFVESPVHDFGIVGQMEIVSTSFRVVNDSKREFVVGRIDKSCSCAEADIVPPKLNPGESGTLQLSWRIGSRRGKVSEAHSLIIRNANGGPDCVLTLRLQASVRPEIECDPTRVTFQNGVPSQAHVTVRAGRKSDGKALGAMLSSAVEGISVTMNAEVVTIAYDGRTLRDIDRHLQLLVVTNSLLIERIQIPITVMGAPPR